MEFQKEKAGTLKAHVRGYAIRKGKEYYIGSMYLGPGKSQAVWDECIERARVVDQFTAARRLQESIGGEVEAVDFFIEI